MMNPDDRFGAAEDILKHHLHGDAIDSAASAELRAEEARAVAVMRQTIATQNSRILAMAAEIGRANEKINESVVYADAAALTLRDAVELLAVATNTPAAVISRKLNEIRSVRYDEVLDAAMAKGVIKEDPRGSELMKRRLWYVSPDQRANAQ
jgi:hypothetical protein